MMDLFGTLPSPDPVDRDMAAARIIAEAIFPASFSSELKVAVPVALPMTPEQNHNRLTLACMPAVGALREKGLM